MSLPRTYVFCLFLLVCLPSFSSAQSFRYIDTSGNIHFVDNLDQVPSQYKNQIEGWVAPTPASGTNKKNAGHTEKDRQREQAKLDKDRKKQDDMRRKNAEKARNQAMRIQQQSKFKLSPDFKKKDPRQLFPDARKPNAQESSPQDAGAQNTDPQDTGSQNNGTQNSQQEELEPPKKSQVLIPRYQDNSGLPQVPVAQPPTGGMPQGYELPPQGQQP